MMNAGPNSKERTLQEFIDLGYINIRIILFATADSNT